MPSQPAEAHRPQVRIEPWKAYSKRNPKSCLWRKRLRYAFGESSAAFLIGRAALADASQSSV